MKLPMVLDKIFKDLVVSFSVLNPSVCLKECLDSIWVTFCLHHDTIVEETQVLRILSLILSDHIVQDNTCVWHVRNNIVHEGGKASVSVSVEFLKRYELELIPMHGTAR